MARRVTGADGHQRLEEAMAMLIQDQAAFLARLADNEKRLAESERATAEQFAELRREMTQVLRVLAEHGRMLERLPEAVREKIGFQRQQ